MNIKTRFIKLILLVGGMSSYNLVYSQSTLGSQCIGEYQNLIKRMKSNEGQYDATVNNYYNLFYFNINPNGSVPSDLKNFFSKDCRFQVDENTGLVFLITESKPESWSNTHRYYLQVFHPIVGPLQFYFDSANGQVFLPKQNKKVSLTSRNYSTEYGFTLVVTDDKDYGTLTTEIEDKYNRCCNLPSLNYLFEREYQLTGLNDYPIESEFNTFFGTKRVLDESKTKTIEYKYFPSYQEKLTIYRSGGLPLGDLENPNFYIIKTKKEEFYKNEVYGRKGNRHFLNDCFEELESSYSNYFIYKSNGKYGILDASWEKLKNSNFIIVNNVYDKITWNKGTGTFTVQQNNETSTIDINSIVGSSITNEKNSEQSQLKSSKTIPDGIKVTYRENGTLESKIEYKDGEQNGIYERYDYWDNPKDIKLSFRCEMKNGKMNGRCEFYVNDKGKYLNGKLDKKRSGIYENDVKLKDL
jgi:antitoxin component YwqK of YwqJK toxin-antitoxin module